MVAIVIPVVLITRPGSPPPTHPLDSILLTEYEINTIMGASNMQTVEDGNGLTPSSMVEVSPQDCIGVLYPGVDQTYQVSGIKDVAWKVMEEPGGMKRAGDGNHHFVDQGVAAFPQHTDRALAHVQASANQWKTCTGQTVTVTYTYSSKYMWIVGNLTSDALPITLSYTQEGGPGYACQRGLSAVSNIVIDVKACGDHITDEASRIVNKIAASVAHAPAF
ncbi:MAG: sensor domain-containing protein [Mycobacterium sp.]|nr:sensor domain-containing protein [Mycobacterium sp.]